MNELIDSAVYVITHFSEILVKIEGAWAHIALATSIAMALLPQGTEGSSWDRIRTALNKVAVNIRNASNERKVS